MKKRSKILIERYVELRCRKLMNECSQQSLNEQYWDLDLGFLGTYSLPTKKQIKKNVKANWKKAKEDPIGMVGDIANFYSDAPIVGKVPGVIGGTIDTVRGLASGDKGQATDGLMNIAFSGMGPGPGKAIKNTVKDMVGDTVNKQVKNVAADTAKIKVKNAYKDNVNPWPDQNTNTNTNVVTAGPTGGGGSNQVAVNTPTTNTNQVAVNTNKTEYVPQSQQRTEYIPQSYGG